MTIDFVDTDAFAFYEVDEDVNGDDANKSGADGATLLEAEVVHVVGQYPYHPPFRVDIVPMVYTASFGGNRGYEEPTTYLRLTFGNEYPRINATLYGPDDNPLPLTTISGVTIDLIKFDIAYETGTFASHAVTVLDQTVLANIGQCYFAWPGTAPIGTHAARFTLYDDQATDVPLLSIPTWPLTVEVREAPHA